MLESIFEQLHFTIPYRIIKGCNKTTLRHFRLQKGVYFIKEGPEIVYVGMSQSCVYKALYRHFERWNGGYPGRSTLSNIITIQWPFTLARIACEWSANS